MIYQKIINLNDILEISIFHDQIVWYHDFSYERAPCKDIVGKLISSEAFLEGTGNSQIPRKPSLS